MGIEKIPLVRSPPSDKLFKFISDFTNESFTYKSKIALSQRCPPGQGPEFFLYITSTVTPEFIQKLPHLGGDVVGASVGTSNFFIVLSNSVLSIEKYLFII